MPKSHDAKPRNKSRREKWQNSQRDTANSIGQSIRPLGLVGPVRTAEARRQYARGLLRKDYIAAVKAQRELESALRQVGIKWRALEKAVATLAGGKWSEVNNDMIEGLFRAHGVPIEETREAA